jgi:soluble lytic murein transglycosylase-like protein
MRYNVAFATIFTAAAGLFYAVGDLHDPVSPTATTVAVAVAGPQAQEAKPLPATTTTTTTTTVLPYIYPPAPETARCPQWWTLAQQAGFTYEDLEVALDRIMWRESRCQPEVRSSTSDSGLLQINDIHLPMLAEHGITAELLFDPWWNLLAGRIIADQAIAYGWRWTQPWSATYP